MTGTPPLCIPHPLVPNPLRTMTITKLLMPLATAVALSGLATVTSAQTLPWNQLSPTASPSSRERAPAATDGNVVYVYGGQVSTTTSGFDELWSFDGTTWTMLTGSGASAGPRSGPAMAWDTARGKLVVFSGKGTGGVWTNHDNETWEWSPTGGWVQAAPTVSPDDHWLFNMVYAPGVGCVFHGGTAWDVSGTAYTDSDTWAFDGTTWTKIATSGPARANGKAIYRPTTHDIVYFGGTDLSGTKVSDTWVLDLGTMTWSQVVTATQPMSSVTASGPGLVSPGGYFDQFSSKVIIHGGQGNSGGPSNLTWEFDGTDWTDVTPASSPSLRNYDLVWYPVLNKGVSALGSTGSATNQTWARGAAAYGYFTVKGTDCATSAGLTATLSVDDMPAINSNLVVDFANLTPGALTLALVGSSNTSTLGIPLPLPMGILFPGSGASCSLQVSNDVGLYTPVPDGTGTGATLTLPVPNNPAYIGLTAYVQGVQIELGTPLTAANTAYGEVVVGQF